MFEYFAAAIFGRTKNLTHFNICSSPILLHFQISRDSQRNMTFIPKTLCKMQKQETGKNLLKYSCLLSLSYFWGWLHICPFPIQIVNSHTELQNLIWNDEWEGKKCHNRFHRFFLYLIQFLYNTSFYCIQNFTISRGRFPGWFVLVSDPPFLISESWILILHFWSLILHFWYLNHPFLVSESWTLILPLFCSLYSTPLSSSTPFTYSILQFFCLHSSRPHVCLYTNLIVNLLK